MKNSNFCATVRDKFESAAKVRIPEGFSMRAGVQLCRLELRAARVDKPRKEEAAGSETGLWGKSADG
jgi:hypothetical protein